MAAEGEFPKVDGDILYASEANHFANSVERHQAGSFIQTLNSGTALQEVGSLVFGVGSLALVSSLDLTFASETSNQTVAFEISGLSTNASLTSRTSPASTDIGFFKSLIGSPLKGMSFLKVINNTGGGEVVKGASINNLDTGSEVVLKSLIQLDTTGKGGIYYSLNVGGGRYA